LVVGDGLTKVFSLSASSQIIKIETLYFSTTMNIEKTNESVLIL